MNVYRDPGLVEAVRKSRLFWIAQHRHEETMPIPSTAALDAIARHIATMDRYLATYAPLIVRAEGGRA